MLFPVWVLVVSLLALVRAGVIDLHFDDEHPPTEAALKKGRFFHSRQLASGRRV